MKYMNTVLAERKFLAGGSAITIADLLIICEVDQLMPEAFGFFDYTPYPNVVRWVGDCKAAMPSYSDVYAPVVQIAKKFALAS